MERKQRSLAEEEARAEAEAATTAYGIPLAPVNSFNCLGIFISVAENKWSEVFRNLCKAR